MSQFINSVTDVSKNYRKYDIWEQNEADKKAKKEWLYKNTEVPKDKIELVKKNAQSVIRATEIMDARSEDNCENMEQVTGMLSIVPAAGVFALQAPLQKKFDKYIDKKYAKRLEEIENKIKEIEKTNLGGRANGVKINNEDSIKKLRELLKEKDKIKGKGMMLALYSVMGLSFLTSIGMILWGNSKQKEASRIGRFQARHDDLKGIENFVNYTPEQIQKAVNIAQKLPNKKEDNSFSKAYKEVKDMFATRPAYKKWQKSRDKNEIEKLKNRDLTPEQIQKGAEQKELITNIVKDINIKAEEYSENLENSFDTLQMLSFLAAVPIGFGVNKLLSMAKASPKTKMWASYLVPTFTALGIGMAGTVEQKEASRIGRYHARKELQKNPANLIAFNEEEMKLAQNINAPKAKKSLFEKISGSFAFLKNYYRDKKEYKNYKENTQKFNEKMQKAFGQINITDAQKAEAKVLQQNVFRAFDEIDEMSQRYSEDIEAGTEIAKTTFTNVWQLGTMAGLALLATGIAKGKIPLAKPLNGLTNMTFAKNSSIRIAINDLYKTLNSQGKNCSKEFQKALCSGDIKNYLAKPENQKIAKAVEKIGTEFATVGLSGASRMTNSANKMTAQEILNELFKDHFKQTLLAKWARNLTMEVMKLKIRKKSPDMPKEVKEQLGLNFSFKNYKTLLGTYLAGCVPIFATIFTIPYMFNAWLTDIQKKAGKIGIMKAMEKIDDPRIFAPSESN